MVIEGIAFTEILEIKMRGQLGRKSWAVRFQVNIGGRKMKYVIMDVDVYERLVKMTENAALSVKNRVDFKGIPDNNPIIKFADVALNELLKYLPKVVYDALTDPKKC